MNSLLNFSEFTTQVGHHLSPFPFIFGRSHPRHTLEGITLGEFDLPGPRKCPFLTGEQWPCPRRFLAHFGTHPSIDGRPQRGRGFMSQFSHERVLSSGESLKLKKSQITMANHGARCYLIEVSSLVLSANCWDHHPNVLKGWNLPDDYISIIHKNQTRILKYAQSIPSTVAWSPLFPATTDELAKSIGKMCQIHKTLDNSVLNAGIACPWPAKMEDTKRMWVHHFFVFQHVLSNLCVRSENQLENLSDRVLPSPYKFTFSNHFLVNG